MLHIKRRLGEEIIIDNNIILKVLSISSNVVTVGFESLNKTSKNLSVLRGEIYERIIEENKNSMKIDPTILKKTSKS
jgi:carbon storage regulator CsrA